MTTRLQLYNTALRHIGESNLSSLTENREPRRVLDQVWDDGFINAILEQGFWKFAARSVKIAFDPSVTPDFGYRYAFAKPDDFVQVAQVCSDEYFNTPLLKYTDEGAYWFTDLDEIYVQFISNGASYGNNLATWPESFNMYAGYALANEIVERLTQSAAKKDAIFKQMKFFLMEAKSKDAMKNPTKFAPPGQWTQSRGGMGGNGGRRDGGNRGGLLG